MQIELPVECANAGNYQSDKEKNMYPDRTYRFFGKEVRVADARPTSSMTLRSGRQSHNFTEGTGTTRATRELAQMGPHPSRIDVHYETPAGTVGHYGASNPEPRRALAQNTWMLAGSAVGGFLGRQLGQAADSYFPSTHGYASAVGTAAGAFIGRLVGEGISRLSRENWHAGHLIPNAAGGSGADARNIVGQHPQTNMGHAGLYPTWRAGEKQMGRDMRNDGGLRMEAHLHDAYKWP
ncbi:MAG: hypothetical protein V4673_06715 [Pseudomonadota bacterium]